MEEETRVKKLSLNTDVGAGDVGIEKLKRQLSAALTALERVKAATKCPDPAEGGCIPRLSCPHEVARDALADIARISQETHAPATWGVKIEPAGEDDGYKATFYVENQFFTLFENQTPDVDGGEDVHAHALWFKDMFMHALARMGVDISTAREYMSIDRYKQTGVTTGRTSSAHENIANGPRAEEAREPEDGGCESTPRR